MNRRLAVVLLVLSVLVARESAVADEEKTLGFSEFEIRALNWTLSKEKRTSLSKAGQKIIARPDVVLCIVDKDGKWRFRAAEDAHLRAVPGEAGDAKLLAEHLQNPNYKQFVKLLRERGPAATQLVAVEVAGDFAVDL